MRPIDADALKERAIRVSTVKLPHTFFKAVGTREIDKAPTIEQPTWISAKDRLPKNFVSVLGYMTDAGEFPPVRECYTVGNVFFFPALGDIHPVSHWMPLPQPPKGVE